MLSGLKTVRPSSPLAANIWNYFGNDVEYINYNDNITRSVISAAWQ